MCQNGASFRVQVPSKRGGWGNALGDVFVRPQKGFPPHEGFLMFFGASQSGDASPYSLALASQGRASAADPLQILHSAGVFTTFGARGWEKRC